MSDFFETIISVVGIAFAIILPVITIMFFILLPIAWLDGHAKSAFLKQQGIELPWYQSAFLQVNIDNHAGRIQILQK